MSYATVEDVEVRWRPLEAEENAVAPTLLSDATDLLDSRMPALAATFGGGGLLDRLTVATVCAMVIRVLRNPDAMRQQSVGDVQQTFGGPEFDGRVYLLSDELAALEDALADAVGGSGGGAFVIDPVSAKLARRAPCRTSPFRPR